MLGLAIATGLAALFGGVEPWVAIALSISAALTFGLLTVQYALFTAAITTYVVLLTDTLGEPALHADAQRALGTAIGIAIAFLAWRLYPDAGESRVTPGGPPLTYWPASQTGRRGAVAAGRSKR